MWSITEKENRPNLIPLLHRYGSLININPYTKKQGVSDFLKHIFMFPFPHFLPLPAFVKRKYFRPTPSFDLRGQQECNLIIHEK